MLDPKSYYGKLWKGKQNHQITPIQNRDWFHRYILDHLFDPLSNARHEVALKLLSPGERLLDIGCWDGNFLERIQRAGLYQELNGVDIISDGVKVASAKGFSVSVVDLNGDPLPFPDGHYDTVTILAVLEHLFDPYSVIKEIHRVLRPGGLLIIDVPNVASFTNRLRLLFGHLPVTSRDPGWDGGHLHYFTKHALDGFLDTAGFDVLQRRTTGGHPNLREWWVSLLGGELIYLCRRR